MAVRLHQFLYFYKNKIKKALEISGNVQKETIYLIDIDAFKKIEAKLILCSYLTIKDL